jgi:cytidine deaminase
MLDNLKIEELIERAEEAIKMAYAPYSKFNVGCAVLSSNNMIFSGSNIENSSYGLSICAERIACSNCVLSQKENKIKAVCIISEYTLN